MVRAFTAPSIEEAERCLRVLKRHGVEAFVKETISKSVTVRGPEVWVADPEDLDRARSIAELRLGPGLDRKDGAPEWREIPKRQRVLEVFALLLLMTAFPVFNSCLPLAVLLTFVALLLSVASGVLGRFRQFQWVDLFALMCFLPAAVGMILRQAPQPVGLGVVCWIVFLALLTLVAWAGTVLFLESEGALNPWIRFLLHVIAFGLLSIIWWLGARAMVALS
jgi:hypothetical protein